MKFFRHQDQGDQAELISESRGTADEVIERDRVFLKMNLLSFLLISHSENASIGQRQASHDTGAVDWEDPAMYFFEILSDVSLFIPFPRTTQFEPKGARMIKYGGSDVSLDRWNP